MNHVDSDLEEGEILDDSPPSTPINTNKELPRRYIVSDNKNNIHKHKKSCRHAEHYHPKKPYKLKKSPIRKKCSPKKYHKPSCSHEKSHKVPDKTFNIGRLYNRYNNSGIPKCASLKNGSHFSQHSLIAEMKDSLKGASFDKLNTKLDNFKPEKIEKQNVPNSEDTIVVSEISSTKQANEIDISVVDNTNPEFSAKNTSDLNSSKSPTLLENSNKIPNDKMSTVELNDTNVKNINTAALNNSSNVKDDESEDEEELRRIALATCAKRKVLRESENMINTDYSCNVPISVLPDNNNVHISHQVTNKFAPDNYEVVDMEVDDDMPDTVEIVETSLKNSKSESAETLFIIDTNPSGDFMGNKENSFKEPQVDCTSTDDEFEADILRAELINSMYRKKIMQEESKQRSNTFVRGKQLAVIQEKKPLINYQKSNLKFCNKRLKSAKHFLRKRSVNKSVSIKNNNKAPPPPVEINKPLERLIITLNDESSEDSDNSDVEESKVTENPVDSIVALISDCRQKSESSTETKEKEIVPKAVSCLSKAQQEEYNSLMKILAEKKKLPSAPVTLPSKNGTVHTPLDDLKKLEEKLVVLKSALKNKRDSVALLSKEVNTKKLHYMKSKLTAQHLKEQLIAAEKVRKSKLLDWSRTCDNLKVMKQSVSNLESKINQVQDLCSKIGSTLQGQSYKLPLPLINNKQS